MTKSKTQPLDAMLLRQTALQLANSYAEKPEETIRRAKLYEQYLKGLTKK